MALTARAARRKIAKLLEALTEREPCQGEGRGFKSLFPLSNQELTRSAECISKVMHSADALFEVCALRFVNLGAIWPRGFPNPPLPTEDTASHHASFCRILPKADVAATFVMIDAARCASPLVLAESARGMRDYS